MFEDILGPKEKSYDDTTEWYGDTEETKGPKILDLSDIIDEDELDKVIEDALKLLDEQFEDDSEKQDGPFGI